VIRPIYTFLAGLVVLLVGLFWIVSTWEPQGEQLSASATQNAELLELTGTTARLAGTDYLETATAYSQAIYAAAQDQDRPGAVVLVRDDDPATAIATTRLQHMPVNAPMLFVTDGGTRLPEATQDELERLGPEGVMMDNNVQVYLAGDISPAVATQIETELGLSTRRIYAEDPVAYTEVLDEFLAVLESDHREIVFIGALEALQYSLPAANWNAHAGDAFAYVTDEGVPEATKRMLDRRAPNYPYIYVFAPPSMVGPEVMAALAQYGHVQRVPGETPQEMAVRWAGYKDSGRMLGWWFGQRERGPGWGVAEPGHNTILANSSDWREVVTTGVLSHMGKHAMLMLTNEDGSLPESVRTYMGDVLKPTYTYPNQQVFNFAWIAGPDESVPDPVMREYAELLEVMGLRTVGEPRARVGELPPPATN
jgi:hypothetical protein